MENHSKVHDRRVRQGKLALRVRSTISGGAGAGAGAGADAGANGESGAVILIHGLGTSHRSNQRLHTELARTETVHSVDLPGFGGLPAPDEPLGVAELARAVAGVLDDLNVTQAVVVGHSMGAQWVVEIAHQRPDLVAQVILIGPVTDPERCTAGEQSLALARDVLGESLGANAVVFSDYLRCRKCWYLAQLKHMLEYPIEQRIARLQMPVLVLRGGNDPVASAAWCRRLRDLAHRGSLVTVPHHRHVVQYTSSRAVASAIRAFVARSVLPALQSR